MVGPEVQRDRGERRRGLAERAGCPAASPRVAAVGRVEARTPRRARPSRKAAADRVGVVEEAAARSGRSRARWRPSWAVGRRRRERVERRRGATRSVRRRRRRRRRSPARGRRGRGRARRARTARSRPAASRTGRRPSRRPGCRRAGAPARSAGSRGRGSRRAAWSRSKRTVSGSTAVAVTPVHDPAPGPVYSRGRWRTATVNTTSSAVTGSPSCQCASGRRWKVQVCAVGSTSPSDRARSPARRAVRVRA